MRTKIIFIAAAVIVVLAAVLWWYEAKAPSYLGEQRGKYENKEYGLTFNYRQQPSGYVVVPRSTSASLPDGQGGMLFGLSMFLYDDYQSINKSGTDKKSLPNISVEIFQNPKNLPPWDWVKTDRRSNYSLSVDKKISLKSVDDKPAAFYEWKGSFRSKGAAVLHNGRIYLFSVGSVSTSDKIRADFDDLLASVRIK